MAMHSFGETMVRVWFEVRAKKSISSPLAQCSTYQLQKQFSLSVRDRYTKYPVHVVASPAAFQKCRDHVLFTNSFFP